MKMARGFTQQSCMSAGFTLIELLVVVVIVGALSAVVLASLTVAHHKSDDAAVEGNLRAILVQAKDFRTANGGRYNTDGKSGVSTAPYACPIGAPNETMFYTESIIRSAIIYAEAAGGGKARCALPPDGKSFAVQVPLKTGGYWCVDSRGAATYSVNLDFTGGLCTASN